MCNSADSQLETKLVEEDVARFNKGAVQVDMSMPAGLPATIGTVAELEISRARESIRRLNQIFFQSGGGHYNFKYRTRRILPSRCPVL